MAKLTARFEMQDKITTKLKQVRAEAERLERIRARLNKPLTLSVRDRASRVLRNIGGFISRDIAKVHRIGLSVRDLASRQLGSVSRFLQKRMPRTHNIMVRGIDRVSPMLGRLLNTMRVGLLNVGIITLRARDIASPVVRRVATYVRTQLGRGYSFTIRAIDRVTRTTGRIGAYINNTLPKTVSSTIRVVDMASRPLRHIASMATSTLGILGITGGATGGIMIPLKMVADREDITTAFEIMLGSADAAKARMTDLTDFAGRTPLTRDEIFRSSRILETFTRGALSTSDGMKIIGDVAVGTQTDLEETATWFGRLYDGMESGRPIGAATSRLQEMGAISGEARERIEKLAESGESIAKAWPKVTAEFSMYDGMMEKMSGNMNNLLLGLRSFIGNFIMIPWGEGLRDALKPALLSFRTWRSEYGFVLQDMSRQLKGWGQSLMNNLLRPTSGVMKSIGNQMKILFPGQGFADAWMSMSPDDFKSYKLEIETMMKEDPEFKKRWEELEKYRNTPFEVRWHLVKANVGHGISEWWENTGRDKAAKLGENIGRTYGGFIRSAILTLLGGSTEETGNIFIDAGATAASNMITGFIEALDPPRLAKALGSAYVEANKSAMRYMWGKITGDEELTEQGSIIGAIIGNAIVLGILAKIGSLTKKLAPLLAGGKWIYDKLFSKGKGKMPAPPVSVGFPSPKRQPVPKTPPHPTGNWPGWFPDKNTKNPVPPKESGWLGKSAKGLGNFAKRIPVLGTLLSTAYIASSDNKLAATGGVAGGTVGASTGAAIGSIVPGLGTLIGGLIGGIIGSIGGEKLVEWIQDHWDTIKSKAADAGQWIADKWNATWDAIIGFGGDVGSWFMESVWNPVIDGGSRAGEWVGKKLGDAKDWVVDKWQSFTENVWTPVKNGVADAGQWISDKYNETKEWVYETWTTVSEWFEETVWTPVKEGAALAGQWIYDRYTDAKNWVSETWSTVSGWFSENVWGPIKLGAALAGQWISDKYQEAKSWVESAWDTVSGWFENNVWTPIKTAVTETGEWISNKYEDAKQAVTDAWQVVTGWFDENIWTPIKEGAKIAGEWIGEQFDNAVTWAQEAWDGVSGWFEDNVWSPVKKGAQDAWTWIKGMWNDAKGWAADITKRGEDITGVKPSTKKSAPKPTGVGVGSTGAAARIAKNATGGHITKPTLSWIGEAGNEYVIPTQNNVGRGKMLLQQAASDLGMQVSDRNNVNQVMQANTASNPTLDGSSLQALNALASSKSGDKKTDVHVEVNFTGDNHYNDEFDAEKHGFKVVKVIKEFLDDELNTGSEGLHEL